MATVLAQAGYDLVLIARRKDRLAAVGDELAKAGAQAEVLVADLSERAGLRNVAERAGVGDIDVLVSNAGVGAYGPFAEIDPVELEHAWTLNADATPVLARAALPGMLERNRGGIITVASMLAFSAGIAAPPTPQGRLMPKRALYVGAKAGMVAFTRVLATELDGTGVHATVVCPGIVSSEWNGGASQIPNAMTPQDVAHAAWVGFSQGEVLCLPGLASEEVLDQLAQAERGILGESFGAGLAARYRLENSARHRDEKTYDGTATEN